MKKPPLWAVPVITLEHGRKYAESWLESHDPFETESWDALDASGIAIFPEDDADVEADASYHAITGKILDRTWKACRTRLLDALAWGFVIATNEAMAADREPSNAAAPWEFVKLTEHGSDVPLWINPRFVLTFQAQGGWTVLELTNGETRLVEESAERVAAILTRGDSSPAGEQ